MDSGRRKNPKNVWLGERKLESESLKRNLMSGISQRMKNMRSQVLQTSRENGSKALGLQLLSDEILQRRLDPSELDTSSESQYTMDDEAMEFDNTPKQKLYSNRIGQRHVPTPTSANLYQDSPITSDEYAETLLRGGACTLPSPSSPQVFDENELVELLGIDGYHNIMMEIEAEIQQEIQRALGEHWLAESEEAGQDPFRDLVFADNEEPLSSSFLDSLEEDQLICPSCSMQAMEIINENAHNLIGTEVKIQEESKPAPMLICRCGLRLSLRSPCTGIILDVGQLREMLSRLFDRHMEICLQHVGTGSGCQLKFVAPGGLESSHFSEGPSENRNTADCSVVPVIVLSTICGFEDALCWLELVYEFEGWFEQEYLAAKLIREAITA